jgi:hypothetical protein
MQDRLSKLVANFESLDFSANRPELFEAGDRPGYRRKTKTYYRTGWRLLSSTPMARMKLNCITGDDVSALRFPGSASNANCGLEPCDACSIKPRNGS